MLANDLPTSATYFVEVDANHPKAVACEPTVADKYHFGVTVYLAEVDIFGLAAHLHALQLKHGNYADFPEDDRGVYVELADEDIAGYWNMEPTLIHTSQQRFRGEVVRQFMPAQIVAAPVGTQHQTRAPQREMTISATAEHLGIHRQTVYDAANDGLVKARRVGRTWLIDTESAEKRWGKKPK